MSRVIAFIKEFNSIQRNNIIIKIAVAIFLVSVIMMGIVSRQYSNDVSKGLADNLIRLHVIANSDSAEDQALKRNVRDAILEYMKVQLKASRDIEQTRFIIDTNMKNIKELAAVKIKEHGRAYPVNITMGSYPFPTKVYGDVTLPAGYYEALRVVIGKGEGANWWCVLFPPLCFVDVTHGTVPETVKTELKETLTEEEYRIITTVDNEGEIPVKIKFKVVEFFQDSKIKFTGLISRIFK